MNKLANFKDRIKYSVNSSLAKSLRSSITATNLSELCSSRANEGVEENASFLTSSNLNFKDFPILSRRISEMILETPPSEREGDNHYNSKRPKYGVNDFSFIDHMGPNFLVTTITNILFSDELCVCVWGGGGGLEKAVTFSLVCVKAIFLCFFTSTRVVLLVPS